METFKLLIYAIEKIVGYSNSKRNLSNYAKRHTFINRYRQFYTKFDWSKSFPKSFKTSFFRKSMSAIVLLYAFYGNIGRIKGCLDKVHEKKLSTLECFQPMPGIRGSENVIISG